MNKKRDLGLEAISKIDDEIVESNLIKRVDMWMSKRKRHGKTWLSVASAAAVILIVFSSVFIFFTNSKVPIYRGMTVSNEAPSVNETLFSVEAGRAKSLSILPLDLLSSDERNKEKGDLAPKPSDELYLAQKNEDIYILVHISNPAGYEILSFTLNGVKYSSYMFEEGSDLETLILKCNVGDVEGLQEYTIDAIKYVDGEKIKNVRMEGDRTVEILVGSSGEHLALNPSFDGWDLVISPVWDEAFDGERKIASLALYEGATMLKELDEGRTRFTDMPYNKRLLLVATYSRNGELLVSQSVIQTPNQSNGLIIINGKVAGIGSCTDTVLYINLPIEDRAFAQNEHITKVYLGKGSTSVGEEAFKNCKKISAIVASGGLEYIGNEAFALCPSLNDIRLGEKLRSIASGAFYGCTALVNISLPNSVTELGAGTPNGYDGHGIFEYCPSLEKVTLPENITEIADYMFSECKKLKNIEIPKKVKRIGACAFKKCFALNKLTLPNGVESIGRFALWGLGVTELEIPKSVKVIDEYALRGCTALQKVTILGDVKVIEQYTFEGCEELKSIVLPGSVSKIGNGAFTECVLLKDVYFSGSVEQWNLVVFDGVSNGLAACTIHCADGVIGK